MTGVNAGITCAMKRARGGVEDLQTRWSSLTLIFFTVWIMLFNVSVFLYPSQLKLSCWSAVWWMHLVWVQFFQQWVEWVARMCLAMPSPQDFSLPWFKKAYTRYEYMYAFGIHGKHVIVVTRFTGCYVEQSKLLLRLSVGFSVFHHFLRTVTIVGLHLILFSDDR